MRLLDAERFAVTPSSGARLPGIEGLRALAAGSIVLVHVWGEASPHARAGLGPLQPHFADLSYGVTLFFTLSGFLLYRPFASAIIANKSRPSLTRYLRNRALRILPAYWVILLFCALLLGSVSFRGPGALIKHGGLTDPGLLGRAAFLVQDYQPGTLLTGIPPAWSLAVEAVFYLVLPLLVLLAWTLSRRARTTRGRIGGALAPAVLMLGIGLVGKEVARVVVPGAVSGGWVANWHSVIERSFLCQADLFAFGMALAVVRALWIEGRLRLPKYWRFAAGLAALAAYAATLPGGSSEDQLTFTPNNTLIAFACSLLLALVVLTPSGGRSPIVRVLETRPFVAAGVVSYSVFLWHEPLIVALHDRGLTFDGRAGFLANLGLVIGLTAALSALTYRFVESPALRLRLKPEARSVPPVLPLGDAAA